MSTSIPILYEDNHVLVAVKPPNMLTQGDNTGDENMLDLLKAYIKQKYDKPGAVYLGLVHRIDRPAGGVLVFARTSKAAQRLSAQMRGHTIDKQYLAVVQGHPPGGALVDWLVKENARSRVVPESYPGAKRAELSYAIEQTAGDLALIRVQLLTGRAHQIRLQLAHAGYPLWGDHRYGQAKPGQQLALWACSLSFDHPTKKERLSFAAPPPDIPPWRDFDFPCV